MEVIGPAVGSASCKFRLVEKEKKRLIEAEGSAFDDKGVEKLFPYRLEGDKLILEGGIADMGIAGTVPLKGEWKRVQEKK